MSSEYQLTFGKMREPDELHGGWYQRSVATLAEAREVAKELVGRHFPAPDFDPLKYHLPLDYGALIYLGKGELEVGMRVVVMGTLEQLGTEVCLWTITALEEDVMRIGSRSVRLFEEED